MFQMPVSQTHVELKPATGAEDMLLLEGSRDTVSLSIALLRRLVHNADGSEFDPADLIVTDLEALLLELRRSLYGDVIASRGRCSSDGCDTPIDVSFRIGEYLAHHGSRVPANVERLEAEPAWFQLRGSDQQFRLVTAGDLAAAMRSPQPELELAKRTIRSASQTSGSRVQKAMQALAPSLSGEIAGQCPECGATVSFWFDVQSYVQRELRYDAEFLCDDVHQLASHYHWTEDAILALPRWRRLQYVEMTLRNAGEN
jgi:hypothetical protein